MGPHRRLHSASLFTASPPRRALAWLCVLALSIPGLPTQRVRAEGSPTLIVLRDQRGKFERELVEEVDRRLLQALNERAGVAATMSPSPFTEVALMANCDKARAAVCAAAISRALASEWVLVRQLRKREGGAIWLSLVAHDGPEAPASRRASAMLASESELDLARLLPDLVGQLYPTRRRPAPAVQEAALVASAAPAPPPAQSATRAAPVTEPSRPRTNPRSKDTRSIAGWTGIALGGALLTAGLGVGVAARRDERDYADLQIDRAEDAMRAQELWSRADKRADYANGLLISGGVTAALGLTMLVWRGVSERRSSPVEVTALPQRGGASLLLRASLPGGTR